MNRPVVEVADILRVKGQHFLDRYRASFDFQQLKAFRALQNCRTAALGGHRDRCVRCGYRAPLFQFVPYGKFFLMGSAVWRKDAQRWRRALPTLHYDLAFSRAISRSDGLNDPLRRCGGKIASMASSFSVGSARV